ncbi:transporter substrate-binding domain-containing protein [Pseudothauera rhizosphaerae]|uniref:Transporter substrate-binding domain-containing protein n=1 Tax=Pseudothauera rhizosphaerae TaxID=2565932 RepID=A0A4S4ASI1_9RHOO|nr:transporter substrate-binding domain-containing protein [Pseudothauera rhizosphaerae]THF62128.1 transporter substrate-binding domain-containing protein [Pseudothauera rhizosphaerae]
MNVHALGRISALLLTAVGLQFATPAQADAIDDIQQRGKLVVGGKSNYKPFGVRNAAGEFEGFSVDLARKVAERLKVGLEIIPTEAANQIQFLEQGKIDVLIAAMNDTPERRKVVAIVEPGYYASAANVMLVKSAGIRDWKELKGRKICANQGAYFNRHVQQEYGAEVIAFKSPPEAYSALQNGNCIGFVYDDNALTQRLEEPQWANYELPLESILPQPVAIAVRHGEERFHALLTELSQEWYRAGYIRELEQKWFPGKRSGYVAELEKKYAAGSK